MIGQRVPLHARPLYQTTGSPSPFGWLRGAEIQHTMFVLRVFCSNYLPTLGLLCRGSPCSSHSLLDPEVPCSPLPSMLVSPSLPPSSTRASLFSLTLPGLRRLCCSLCPGLFPPLFPPHLSQGSLSHCPPGQPPLYSPPPTGLRAFPYHGLVSPLSHSLFICVLI